MIDLKNIIRALIKSHPKHWGALAAKDQGLLAVLGPIMDQYDITVQAAAYCFINDMTPICQYNKEKSFTWFAKGFAYCGKRDVCRCNSEAATEKSKNTNLERYGSTSFAKTDEYKKKTKETNLRKFGVEQASWNADVRSKARATCKQKYGTEFPIQLTEFKDKLKHTKEFKHGDPYYSNTQKRMQTLIEKYGVDNPTYIGMSPTQINTLKDKQQFCEFITGKSRQFAAQQLDVDWNTIEKYAITHNCSSLFTVTGSKWEEELTRLFDSLGVKYERNNRSLIAPLELDFYLPDFNTAIEVNGNYWHCEDKKGRFYHYTKWELCRKLGIDLLQYFEDEFENSWPIIESKIRYVCKKHTKRIGARQVTLNSISNKDEKEFLEKNHMQGYTTNKNSSLAAYYNNQIIGIISWLHRKQYLEIVRFTTQIGIISPGLFSKMLVSVIAELKYSGRIVSFSNNGHSNGNLYKAAGFTLTDILGPAYWYMKNYSTRENRQCYMKSKIKKKFNIDITGKTEKELMTSLGYKRIWDSGKLKWELNIGESNGKITDCE